jgi:hypothetical protein
MMKRIIERIISISMGMAVGVAVLVYLPPLLKSAIEFASETIQELRADRQERFKITLPGRE